MWLPTVAQVIATYTYQPRQDDELGFTKGSVINVLHKQDADWWRGEQGGRVGMFPANYVTALSGVTASSGAVDISLHSPAPPHLTSCELLSSTSFMFNVTKTQSIEDKG